MFNQVTKQKFGKLIETPLQNVAVLASQKDQKGMYLKPVQKIFESLDAIIPSRVGFQMIVASSNPIETAGLHQVVNALGCTKQRRFALYFVVPRDIYDGYRKQRYLDNSTQAQKDGSTEINLQKDDNQKFEFNAKEVVKQWILCMDLNPKY